MKKIVKVAALIADLAPGATLVLAGIAVIVGGATGTLWL